MDVEVECLSCYSETKPNFSLMLSVLNQSGMNI